MTTATMPAHTTVGHWRERLDALSKHELVEIAAKAKAGVHHFKHKHGSTIKRVGMIFAQTTVATVVGAGFGLLELKMPRIPKTRIRFDSIGALVLSGVNATGVFEEMLPLAQSAADSMTGHASGRYSEEFFVKHGVRRTAAP
jgi:hypothetical protein